MWPISTSTNLIKHFVKNPKFAFLGPSSLIGRIVLVSAGLPILSWFALQRNRRTKKEIFLRQMRPKRLIVITGCDSGLGLSMANWAGKLGYRILAGCLDDVGEGANFLKKEFKESCRVVRLDVTKAESLNDFRDECKTIIENGEEGNRIELWALILNAAIGSFGEFFWQTSEQCQQIMNVNFWGSVNLTKAFESLLLQEKSRLIVISSDCANYPLPGLAIYSASKASLETWAHSLRREVGKYGISVVSFQPGSFPLTSRLFARQSIIYNEMKNQMSEEKRAFYGQHFEDFNNHAINTFSIAPLPIAPIDNKTLRKYFISLLEEDVRYKPVVIYEQPIVSVLHFLLRNCPAKFGDLLITKMLQFPKFKPSAVQLQNERKNQK